MRKILVLAALLVTLGLNAQEQEKKDKRTLDIHGTIRGKYEYQNQEKEDRFEVRNARFSLSGNVTDRVSYKAEIDLSEEGKIKMLDAYGRVNPWSTLQFTIGQMRVPFTIDAHRSPHQQYFANRSFIAKQVGNVRDVGFTTGYTFNNTGFTIILEAGLFNGSGLTNQKDYWTNKINFSAKAQMFVPGGFNLTLSTQKVRPENVNIMMYDAGAYYQGHGCHIEAEYLYKHYADNAFKAVHSFDGFVNYDIKVGGKKPLIRKVSPLVRYDYMSDHSDGTTNEEGKLYITDYQRSRVTCGVTLSLGGPFISDLRLNYEKYFYRDGAQPKVSERDKWVCELMVRF